MYRKRDGRVVYTVPDILFSEFGIEDERTALMLGLIYTSCSSSKNGIASIASTYFRGIIGQNYMKHLNKLMDSGLVIRSGKYAKGLRCYKYSIPGFIREVGSREIGVRPGRFRDLLNDFLDKMDNEEKSKWTTIHHIIDVLEKRPVFSKESVEFALGEVEDEFVRASQRNAVSSVIFGDVRTIKLGTTGRVFSPFTGMKSIVRSAAEADGERMVGIDIKASQPTLISILLKGQFKNIVTDETSIRFKRFNICPFSRFADSVSEKEVYKYMDIVENGDIYEYIHKAMPASYRMVFDRELIKVHFMRDIFAKKGSYESRVEDTFKKEFPGILGEIRKFNKTSHSNFIRTMQFIESELVLAFCLDHAYENGLDAAFTVHDSIYEKQSQCELVEDAFDLASKKVGVKIRYERQATIEDYMDHAVAVDSEFERAG